MILTQKYKFKKRELTDSPPDITATEDNWDKAEKELDNQAKQINVLLPLLGSSTALKTAEELNNLKTNGEYMFSPLADITIGGQTFTNGFVYNVKVEVNLWEGANPVVTQTITCGYSHVGDKRMLWRTFYAVGDWSPFNNVATTAKIDVPFSYNEKYMDYGAPYITTIYKSNNYIECHIVFKYKTGQMESGLHPIGTMPSGYRPKYHISIGRVNSDGYIEIRNTGEVYVSFTQTTNSYGIVASYFIE